MPLHADLIVHNARIATMARDGRQASALAVQAGRIVALGADHEIVDLGGPGTRRVDLQGRRVVPGIVDSHTHPDSYAIRLAKWHRVGPEKIAGRDELLALIDRATATGPADRWFAGYRFDDRRSGGYPTQAELDRAGNGRPVFILRTDGHLALANKAAFAACGIGGNAVDPPFGRFDRDPVTNDFTGLVRETAAHIFLARIHAEDRESEIADGMDQVFREALSHGITSIYNSLTPARAIRAYQKMKDEGRLACRIGIIASGREDGLIEALTQAGMRSGFGDERLRLVAVEWCPDCSTSGRTAAYYEPYVGTPILGEPANNTGMLLYEAEDLKRRAIAAHRAGHLVCIEGVGDRGIDFALDAIEAALAAHPVADHRMRVEHCCYVTPAILDRIARLGVVDSSATGFMYDLGDAYADNRGDRAMRWMWPHRSLIDAGIPAPGHSDFAVCRVNPWTAMWSMVARKSESGRSLDAREAITVPEALNAYTWLGAFSGREEHEKGSLEIGKLADFVVLDRDVLAGPVDALRETRVLSTWVGGVEAWRAED